MSDNKDLGSLPPTRGEGQGRNCTCHPDDSPPTPCARKYALSECVSAQDAAGLVEALMPFAAVSVPDAWPDERQLLGSVLATPTCGQLRGARQALAAFRTSPTREVEGFEEAAADARTGTGPTPGPWIVETTALHLWVGYPKAWAPKVSEVVCHFEVGPHYAEDANARCAANARLIAASPALADSATEIDRLSLVIESAVRDADPSNHADVLAALKANRAALSLAHTEPSQGER